MKSGVLPAATVFLLVSQVLGIFGCAGTRPATATNTASTSRHHDNPGAPESQWHRVVLGGVPQWIHISGARRDLSVMLFLHGGPGTPETPFLHEYIPYLAEEVVLVSWEQRGAGRSFSTAIPPETMTIEQFIRDTLELSAYLRRLFNVEKIYLAGHSWGTIPGMHAVHRRPEDFYAYIAIAQTAHGTREEAITYQRVLDQARTAGNRRAVRQLEQIGPPTDGAYRRQSHLGTKLKWVRYFGGGPFHTETGITPLVRTVLRSPLYTIREKINYLRGEAFALRHLLHEVRQIDLFQDVRDVEVPVYFFHGRHDNQVPPEVAVEYFEYLNAPRKRFFLFEESAHGVLFEEPERFIRILRDEILTEEAQR